MRPTQQLCARHSRRIGVLENISADGSVVNYVTNLSKFSGFTGKYGSVCALSANGKQCVVSGTGTNSTFYYALNNEGQVVKEIDLSQNLEHFGSNVEISKNGNFVLVSGTNKSPTLNSSEYAGNVYWYKIENNELTKTVNLSKSANLVGRYGDSISMANDGMSLWFPVPTLRWTTGLCTIR